MENDHLIDSKISRKRARTIAIVLGISVIINLIFLMYAFIQKAEAEKQRELAFNYQKLSTDLHDHEERIIADLREEIDSLKGACVAK
jgi:predicted negative regulator of RcsB-dependent stress response